MARMTTIKADTLMDAIYAKREVYGWMNCMPKIIIMNPEEYLRLRLELIDRYGNRFTSTIQFKEQRIEKVFGMKIQVSDEIKSFIFAEDVSK